MKISVVVPVYNEEELLGKCLYSLLKQTVKAYEIIIVDNNSTDRTAEIADTYGATIIQETNQGIWAASATGYDEVKGEIIARCDADSILPEDWLARIDSIFQDKTINAVTGPGKFYGANQFFCKMADLFYMKTYFLTVGSALNGTPLFGSNFAMRKSSWECARPLIHKVENIHDDIDLSYHLPIGTIRYDKNLTAQISIRPLKNIVQLPTRYLKGFRSIVIHWPEQSPWRIRRR